MKMTAVFHKKEKKEEQGEKRTSGKVRRNQMIISVFALMIAAAGYLNYADKMNGASSGQEAELEAANAAADAVYGEDELLQSDDDIVSLDVDYDLVLSEDDLLEEVTEAQTAQDKDAPADTQTEDSDTATDTQTEDSDTATGTQTEGSDTTAGIETDSDTGEESDVASSGVGETLFVSSTGVLTFVAEAKLSREQARAKSKETLLEIVDNDALSESAKQSAIDAMIELSDISVMETAAETLLAAKGFTNAVVTIQDNSVDVIINAEQLSDSDRAKIEDIITQKTGISVENITIVPLRESED